MAFILHFRGEGHMLMRGVKEYITLVDADALDAEEVNSYRAIGFELQSKIEIDADISELPCDEALAPCP